MGSSSGGWILQDLSETEVVHMSLSRMAKVLRKGALF